jgi:acetyl-CoA carboxylase carboxyl transferase subunit alpha
LGGAHTDLNAAAKELKKVILKHLKDLGAKKIEDVISERIDKFSNMGVYS